MVELSRNARVAVRNPTTVVGYSAPRSIEARVFTRGPSGPSGGPIPAGGTAGQVVTPDGFGDYVWTTVGAILGLSGNAVGTSDVQVLTNKDLSSATNTFPSSLATDAELSAHSTATAAHGASGAIVGTTNVQTITNKTIGSTNTINGFTASRFMQSDGTGKLTASTKTLPSGTVVGTTDTQTLTNKTVINSDTWHTVGGAGEPAYQNGWTLSSGNGAQFFKDAIGIVHLTGLVKPGANGTVVFTLPVGYRPSVDLPGFVVYQDGVTPQMGVCQVYADGRVELWKGGHTSMGTRLGLSGVEFPTA